MSYYGNRRLGGDNKGCWLGIKNRSFDDENFCL